MSLKINVTSFAIRAATKSIKGKNPVAISIIITTHTRASYLNFTLIALENQSMPKDLWEVIVVDNGSSDETSLLLDGYLKNDRFTLTKKIMVNGASLSMSLNAGLSLAKGNIVLFLSDDQIVDPNFLLHHLNSHIKGNRIVLGSMHQGVHTHLFAFDTPNNIGIEPKPIFTNQEFVDFIIRSEGSKQNMLTFVKDNNYFPVFQYYSDTNSEVMYPWIYFSLSNVSIYREDIISLGGFDEGYENWNLGEWGLLDIDVGYRLHRSGKKLAFQPLAITLHQHHPKTEYSLEKKHRNLNYFCNKYPDLGINIEFMLSNI